MLDICTQLRAGHPELAVCHIHAGPARVLKITSIGFAPGQIVANAGGQERSESNSLENDDKSQFFPASNAQLWNVRWTG
jgi:hypothetical protein